MVSIKKKAPLFPPEIELESMEENLFLDDVLEAVARRYMDTKQEEDDEIYVPKKKKRRKN